MQGGKGLEAPPLGSRGDRGRATKTLSCTLSLYLYTKHTLMLYISTHTHIQYNIYTQIGKTISRQDDSRALEDTTAGRLRQVSNNSLKEQADS